MNLLVSSDFPVILGIGVMTIGGSGGISIISAVAYKVIPPVGEWYKVFAQIMSEVMFRLIPLVGIYSAFQSTWEVMFRLMLLVGIYSMFQSVADNAPTPIITAPVVV